MTKQLQERLTAYTELVRTDLAAVATMLDQMADFAVTEDPHRVHELLLALDEGELHDYWVRVPRQYSTADVFLIAMDRFMTFAGIPAYSIRMPDDREELTMLMTDLDMPAAFEFETPGEGRDGAYFVEVNSGKKLFYWSPERKQLLFNSEDLTDLLVGNYRKKTTAARIRTLTHLLTEFGYYMERQFGYHVDYNILETRDDFLYPLVQTEMPAGMLDRLFVLSAESDFFLQAIPNGAGMVLDGNVEVRIFFVTDPIAPAGERWHFQVIDGKDAYSWLDVLLDYDFIGAWYLVERQYLAVASDEMAFGVRGTLSPVLNPTPKVSESPDTETVLGGTQTAPTGEAENVVQVEVLQPRKSEAD
jgi:hypothetical protein